MAEALGGEKPRRMLTFYINRAGGKVAKAQRSRLEAATDELRDLYRPRRSSG